MRYTIGLILTGLAGYGAYEAYATALAEQRIESLQIQVSSIQRQIVAQYQRSEGRYNFGVLSANTLINKGIVPKSVIKGNLIVNPFRGTYSVIGNNDGLTPPSTFSVVADNIPENDCEWIIKSLGVGRFFYGYAIGTSIAGSGIVTAVFTDTDRNAHASCGAPGAEKVAIRFVING